MANPEMSQRAAQAHADAFVDFQQGWPLVAFLSTTSGSTLAWTWLSGPHIAATALLLPQLIAMVCFCTQRIRVDGQWLEWQYGPGWLRGRQPLAEVVTTRLVLSPLAYGWGFRRTAHGWRFSRVGALALEIEFRTGRRLRLGTPRAHELQLLIETARGRLHRLS